MKLKSPVKLIISIIICQLAGIIGSFFTVSSIPEWYSTLQKPFFNPPNWLFGPVWTLLYFMMGISLYLIWVNKDQLEKKVIIIFGTQLFLNTIWPIIFFGLKTPFWALIEIIFLWIAILLTIIESYQISKKAAYLLVPYLLWVSFAAILNLFLWQLN